jgi:hypothetical protein
MRKLFLWLLPIALSAAPVGNGAAPALLQKGMFLSSADWLSLRSGYEGDFVSDARLKQYAQGQGRVDEYSQENNSGTVTLNTVRRLDLYGVFGSSATEANWRFNLNTAVHRIKMETHQSFLWAVGGRAILYEWSNLFLGVGGRYTRSEAPPRWLKFDGAKVSVAGTEVRWEDWQINLDFSYRIKLFTPYIGFKYAENRVHLGNFSVPIAADGSGSNSFKNRQPVGLYIGCGLTTGQYFMMNIEGRVIDEEAITISGEFRF